MKICSQCGHDNDEAQSVCNCGAPLTPECQSVPPVIGQQSSPPKIRRSTPRARLRWLLIASVIGIILLLFLLPSDPIYFDTVEIRGNARFKEQVVSSLTLLKDKAPETYAVVTNYIGLIKQARHSGMKAYAKPPTFLLNDNTAYYSVTWCASSIAHDSFHSKLFHDYLRAHPPRSPDDLQKADWERVPYHIWCGEAAEKKCGEYQTGVLRAIGAPMHEIDHARWDPNNRYWEVERSKQNW